MFISVRQRPLWPELESEANEELLAKLLHAEAFLNEANPTVVSSPVALFDQAEGHPRGLQKRGRRTCLIVTVPFSLIVCLISRVFMESLQLGTGQTIVAFNGTIILIQFG